MIGQNRRMLCRPRTNRTAFTLVEMLVIATVLAILLSFLLPGLRHAFESARLVACAANQKQILFALSGYTNDSHGFLPHTQKNEMGRKECPELADMLRPYGVELSNVAKPPSTLNCPSVPKYWDWASQNIQGYYLNDMFRQCNPDGTPYGYTLKAVRTPGKVFLFMDPFYNYLLGADAMNLEKWPYLTRHDNQRVFNAAYFDLHVAALDAFAHCQNTAVHAGTHPGYGTVTIFNTTNNAVCLVCH